VEELQVTWAVEA
jgi:hypothetical protein